MKIDAGKVVTAYEEPKKPKSIYNLLRTKSWTEWKDTLEHPQETPSLADLPEKIWEATKEKFHQLLDKELKNRDGTFTHPLRQDDSTQFWQLWSTTFEEPLLNYCGISQDEAKH